jgi:tetratricopeptide (TPR) repeat protein
LIYYDSGDLENARSYAEKTFELTRKNGEQAREAMASIYLGLILWRMESKKSNRAEHLTLHGMKRLEERGLRPYIAQQSLFIGELYIDIGQKEKALEYLKKADSMSKEMDVGYWGARAYTVYAELYKKEGKTSKAKENLNKAIEIFKECGADGWVNKYEKELAALS